MPGTPVLDDIELIIEDVRGTGGGKPPSRDGDDGGDGEGGGGGERTPDPRRPAARKYSTGIAVAMLSIVMLFMVLAAAFLVSKQNNLYWGAVGMPAIVWANTGVLLLSSGTLELARRKLARDDARGFRRLWALTIALGTAFLLGQVVAWRQLAAAWAYTASRQASSYFYVFTALHAAHLLGGICALVYVGVRRFDAARLSRGAAAEIASYYWHFMDGLWLFLFALLSIAQ